MNKHKMAKYGVIILIAVSVLLAFHLFITKPRYAAPQILTIYARKDTVLIPNYVIDSVVLKSKGLKEKNFIEDHDDVFFGSLFTGINAIIGILVLYYLNSKNKNIYTEYDLSHHPVFNEMELLINREINKFTFGSEGRTELFRFLLRTQVQTFYNHLQQYIKQETVYTYPTDIEADINKLLAEILNAYEAECRREDVPEAVITKFGNIQESRIQILDADMDHIIFDRSIDSYNNVKYEILSAVARHIRLTVMEDVLETIKSLNGELKKLTFRGKAL